jgi:hypothetical protein
MARGKGGASAHLFEDGQQQESIKNTIGIAGYPRRNWVDAITERLYLNQDLR